MKPKVPPAAPLEADVVAILLGGWCCEPPGGRQKQSGFTRATFELFYGNVPKVAELWQQHEPYLRDQAARWGLAPACELADGTLGFFGELAIEEAASSPRWNRTGGDVVA